MNREELLDQLYGLEREGIKLGLEPTRRLLLRCGSPHLTFTSIQIAGTNGKGSTAAMIAAILGRHGSKVGLYTSPHLINFNERIRIDGSPIPDGYLKAWMERHAVDIKAESATFFEATTALALTYFAEMGVDWAVLETGLGGRLDATTEAGSRFGAFCPIALDHVELLGQTITEIAKEKAGIMRHGMVCFSSPQLPEAATVLRRTSTDIGASLKFVDGSSDIPQPQNLRGEHQRQNARLATAVSQAVLGEVYDRQLGNLALESVVWPGRYQQLSAAPKVIYDVAHNPHAMAVVLDVLKNETVAGKRWAILALQADKNAAAVAQLMSDQFDVIMVTQSGTRKFLPAVEVQQVMQNYCDDIRVESDAQTAIEDVLAEAESDDLIAILGSHYLGPAIGEVFKISFDKLQNLPQLRT